MKKFNCLFLMMDQLRFDALGFSSGGLVDTPNLDRLASMGTVFTKAYTPSPSCIPARAAIMTGQKPWTNGVLFTGDANGPRKLGGVMGCNFSHTLAGELVKNGYHAEGIGKMHFFPQRALMGFSHTLVDESAREESKNFISDYKEWFLRNNPHMYGITDHGIHWNSWMARPFHADESYHPSNWTINESLKFLRNRDPSMPFFLYVSFTRPHSPYDASQYFFDLYKDKEKPKPVHGKWSEKYKDFNGSISAWHGDIGEDRRNAAYCGYFGSITQTDYQIGRLLVALEEQKLLDDTLIIFTSDHGDMMGDHYLMRKTYAYEGSSHVPFIIKLPKSMERPGGCISECEVPVSLYDIMPTILDICGCEIPISTEGISLASICNGGKIDRKIVEGEHIECYSRDEENFYVTDGKFKYVYLIRTGKELLFNLKEDPYETVNLIGNKLYLDSETILRNHTINELYRWNNEDITFVKDGKLIPVPMHMDIVSPNYQKRLDTSEYKWM